MSAYFATLQLTHPYPLSALNGSRGDKSFSDDCSFTEPSGHTFLLGGYDTAIFCFSKHLPVSSTVPDVPDVPIIPAKEAKNRPTLSMH